MANSYDIIKDGKPIELGFSNGRVMTLREYSEVRAERSARMEKQTFPDAKIEVVGPPEYGTREITL